MGGADAAGRSTEQLVELLAVHLDDVSVAPVALHDSASSVDVALRMLGCAPAHHTHRGAGSRLSLTLSYLVTVRLDDPVAEHRVAAAIAFAVMSAQGFELSDRSAAETCVAIGLPPAAGCVIIASIEQERVMPRAPLVREPARINISPADWLDGIVLGPGDVPVAGAYVRLADAATVTGPDGRFRFRVPAETTVEVTARARHVGASVQAKPGTPARISLPLEA